MRQDKETNLTEQEILKARKGNKEDKRQQLRKGAENSSRLLDNYYNPKIHPHNWRPTNSKITHSNSSNYNDSGFNSNYDYNKGSLNNNKERVIKKQIHFLEFDYMENNDSIIIIEHCSKCNEHQSHSQHINNIYQNISKYLQRSILLRFPFIKVYLKPIDVQITNISKIKSTGLEDNSKDIRIRAMEIQYAHKIDNNVTITLIHSKLNTGLWPNFANVLNKISFIVPVLNIKCVLYDKEEGLNDENKQIDEFLPSKFENIKVNLYILYNEQIELYSQEAMDELNMILNPKRRQMALNEQLQQQDQLGNSKGNYSIMTTLNNNNNTNSTISRPTTSRVSRMSSNTMRPITGKSSYSHRKANSLNRQTHNFQGRPTSSSTNHYSTYIRRLNGLETLDDPETINRMKGKLLSSGYTDNGGYLTFQNVPYDSYIIEIEASKNFLMSATFTRFNKIMQLIKSNDKLITLNKYFGLRRQIDSYVEVYLYSNENKNELDPNLINNAKVYLIRSYECEVSLFPPGENKLLLKESKDVKGRYEIVTSTGKVFLEVHKEGYESIKKEINLRTGENKINIEMN